MKFKSYIFRFLCLTLLLMIGASGLHAQVDYLCFTADQANSTVELRGINLPTPDFQIQIKKGDGNWEDYTLGAKITLEAIGDKVYFKGDYKAAGEWQFVQFNMYGKISASGNIMTLTDGDAPTTSLAGKEYCFRFLFTGSGCQANLTTAPELPATTLAPYCYSNMFMGCKALTNAPTLPAETLADYCYDGMFQGCTGLSSLPNLPATIMAEGCYFNMFNGCTGLTTVPTLPTTTLAKRCYWGMFQECTELTTASHYLLPHWQRAVTKECSKAAQS